MNVQLGKNPKKMHANLIRYQVENSPTLPGRNLISICNCRVKSSSVGRVEVSSRQAGIMQLPPQKWPYADVLQNTCSEKFRIMYSKLKRDFNTDVLL